MICSNICINNGINGMCDTGMGGIKQVAITNWADTLFTAYTDTSVGDSSIGALSYVTAFVDGTDCGSKDGWFLFTFRKNTANMTSTLNVDDANGVNYVQTDLQLTFNRMEQEKRVALANLIQAPVAAVVQDANNNYWALGYWEPVIVSAGEGVTGTNRTDGNHYSITLTDVGNEFPLPVQNGKEIIDNAAF